MGVAVFGVAIIAGGYCSSLYVYGPYLVFV